MNTRLTRKRRRELTGEMRVSEEGSSEEDESDAGTLSAAVKSFMECETFAKESDGHRPSELVDYISMLQDAWNNMTQGERDEYLDRFIEAKITLRVNSREQDEEIKGSETQNELLNYYLQSIDDLEKCEPGDVFALENLVNTFRSTKRSILAMKNMTPELFADVLWRRNLEKQLDDETRMAWEYSEKAGEIPTCEELYTFLDRRISAQRCIALWKSSPSNNKVIKLEEDNNKCAICNGDHLNRNCTKHLNWTVKARKQMIIKLQLCYLCLSGGHFAFGCEALPCAICQGRHHVTLCPNA